MKYQLLLIFTVLVLASCGKELPKVDTTDGGPQQSASPSPTAVTPAKDVKTTCQTQVSFLDATSATFTIVQHPNKTKDVSCTVTSNSGTKYTTTQSYPSKIYPYDDPSFQFFSFCKVYYKTSYWVTFNIGGTYIASQPDLDPSKVGWDIPNITNVVGDPGDGRHFSSTTCSVQQ